MGTGARERERCAREDERRAAASTDGCGCSAASAGQSVAGGTISSSSAGRVRDAARAGVSSSCAACASSPAAPHPTPHATSSTIAIVQRSAGAFSKQPCRIRSAPRPMSAGVWYVPANDRVSRISK